jgi:transcriptional regulator with XRE-family HTH domain
MSSIQPECVRLIKFVRHQREQTQKTLALMMNVPRSYISKIESGNIYVGERFVRRFCEAQQVSPFEFLTIAEALQSIRGFNEKER